MGYQKITFSGGALWWLLFFELKRRTVTYRREFIIFIGISSDVVPFTEPCVCVLVVQDSNSNSSSSSIWPQFFDWLIGKKSDGKFIDVSRTRASQEKFHLLKCFHAGVFDCLFSAARLPEKNLLLMSKVFKIPTERDLRKKDTRTGTTTTTGARANVNQALVLFN